MYLKDLLDWGIQSLKNVGIETARLDAEVLLAHVLRKERGQLYIDMQEPVGEEGESRYRSFIGKRIAHTPVTYLTGHKEFMSLDFIVNESVLIPRPDTEVLVETVCKIGKPGSRVLELGTGSGAIAVSLAKYREDWRILATDLSMDALLAAKENARLNGVIDRVFFVQMDLFDALCTMNRATPCTINCATTGLFDWVVSNPPYVPSEEISGLPYEISMYEPRLALDGGKDGLDVIRKILLDAYKVLKPDGNLAIEIGFGQGESVRVIADEVGRYSNCSIIKDYSGIPRVFYCQIRNSDV